LDCKHYSSAKLGQIDRASISMPLFVYSLVVQGHENKKKWVCLTLSADPS
jgi:hypothetical protein